MELLEVFLPHGGDAVHLVEDELGVHVDADVLDTVASRELQFLDRPPVLRHVVGGEADRPRDLCDEGEPAGPQERADRGVGQRLSGAAPEEAPVSVQEVAPRLGAAGSAASASGVSGPGSGVSPSRTRCTESERVSRGRRGSNVQTLALIVGSGEQMSGHLGRRQLRSPRRRRRRHPTAASSDHCGAVLRSLGAELPAHSPVARLRWAVAEWPLVAA